MKKELCSTLLCLLLFISSVLVSTAATRNVGCTLPIKLDTPRISSNQESQLISIAVHFLTINMPSILGSNYTPFETFPLFEFSHTISEENGKLYLIVYLHEKPCDISRIEEIIAKGYTNLVFEITLKPVTLFFPYLVRTYPKVEYIYEKIKASEINEGEIDLRNLIDIDDLQGEQHYLEPKERKFTSYRERDFIHNPAIKNLWLPPLCIVLPLSEIGKKSIANLK